MQIIFILICAFLILWALEIRHRESNTNIAKALDEIEKIKDEISSLSRQLKVLSQKLIKVGISSS